MREAANKYKKKLEKMSEAELYKEWNRVMRWMKQKEENQNV